jgi:hypothetical protein
VTVANGGDLQAALDAAVPGDTILLAVGAIFSAGYVIGPKTGGIAGGWITVKSAGSIPAENTRITPTLAALYNLPRIRMLGFSPGLLTAASANNWRFIGIEFDVSTSVTSCGGIILCGDASPAQDTLAKVPTDLIFDRVYIHGHPALDCRKGIAFNSARTAIVDSWISEIHSAFDAQAITGSNGPGPFKIVNNHLEGLAENIAWGGADPRIANLVPSDIEVRRNHFYKPLDLQGTGWLEKELNESKNSRYVWFEGNVLENSWMNGQLGWIMGLWSVNQESTAPWSVTEHWTVENNVAKNVTAGFSLTAKFSTPSPKANNITVRNNVVIGLQGDNPAFSLYDVPYLTIEHNTVLSAGGPAISWSLDGPAGNATPGQVIKNNILGGGYYLLSTGYGQGLTAWNLAHGDDSAFSHNVLVQQAPELYHGLGGWTDNAYVFDPADVKFAGGAGAPFSLASTLADMALANDSPYKGAGDDGEDLGADMAVIAAAVAGVGGGF